MGKSKLNHKMKTRSKAKIQHQGPVIEDSDFYIPILSPTQLEEAFFGLVSGKSIDTILNKSPKDIPTLLAAAAKGEAFFRTCIGFPANPSPLSSALPASPVENKEALDPVGTLEDSSSDAPLRTGVDNSKLNRVSSPTDLAIVPFNFDFDEFAKEGFGGSTGLDLAKQYSLGASVVDDSIGLIAGSPNHEGRQAEFSVNAFNDLAISTMLNGDGISSDQTNVLNVLSVDSFVTNAARLEEPSSKYIQQVVGVSKVDPRAITTVVGEVSCLDDGAGAAAASVGDVLSLIVPEKSARQGTKLPQRPGSYNRAHPSSCAGYRRITQRVKMQATPNVNKEVYACRNVSTLRSSTPTMSATNRDKLNTAE